MKKTNIKKGFWQNKDNCYKVALECSSRNEFRQKYYSAYYNALRNKWIEEWEWLQPKLIYWTNEQVIEESKKYKTKSDFQRTNPSCYVYARKHKLLDLMVWHTPLCKPNGFWYVKENCIQESKKYKSRTEFEKKCVGAYQQSRKNGWLDEMTWLQTPPLPICDINSLLYVIYVYEIQETHAAYIGLTKNLTRRHYQHNNKSKKKHQKDYSYDTLKQYCIDKNLPLPIPIILEKDLNYQQAQKQEKFWADDYKDKGWHIINKGKMGINVSSIGGNSIKWTHDKVIEESKKYTLKKDFYQNSIGAYHYALKHKLLTQMTWLKENHKPKGYWEDFNNIQLIAKDITKDVFKKKYNQAYRSALKHHWMNDLIFFN